MIIFLICFVKIGIFYLDLFKMHLYLVICFRSNCTTDMCEYVLVLNVFFFIFFKFTQLSFFCKNKTKNKSKEINHNFEYL